MGKKKFIDKKKSTTFTLVCRDSSDPLIDQSDRVFTRIDRGQGHVAGFTDKDLADSSRSDAWAASRGEQVGERSGTYEEEEEDDGDGDRDDDEDDDSKFADAEEEEGRQGQGEDRDARAPGRGVAQRMKKAMTGEPSWREARGDGRSGSQLSDERRRALVEMGFADDGYDYLKHLRKIRSERVGALGGATFLAVAKPRFDLAPDVKAFDASGVSVTTRVADEAVDMGRLSTAEIDALSTRTREIRHTRGMAGRSLKGIDPELLAAMESSGDEAGDSDDDGRFEDSADLEDDFVAIANADGEGGAETSAMVEETKEKLGGEGSRAREKRLAVEKKFKQPMEDEDEDDEHVDGDGDGTKSEQQRCVSSAADRPSRLLDEQFEQLALREYDDDDDELEDDPEVRGHADISQFSGALDEFLLSRDLYLDKYHTPAEIPKFERSGKNDDEPSISTGRAVAIDKVEKDGEQCSLGLKSASGESNARGVQISSEGQGQVRNEDGGGDTDGDSGTEEEEEFVSVEDEEERERWDCETIVSTYSNLDNHPARIGAPGRAKKVGSTADNAFRVTPGIIRLGGRQQLPLDFLPKREEKDKGTKVVGKDKGLSGSRRKVLSKGEMVEDDSSEHGGKRGGPRAGETAEERKARKALVKEARREARVAKKTLKLVFRDEGRRAQRVGAQAIPQGIHLP